MKVTSWTRRALAIRREARDYKGAGWERCPVPLDLINGGRCRSKIVAAEVGVDGKTVWIKIEEKR